MRFSYLELRNYRNYPHLQLQLNPGVNVFFGSNGQGKTNLIEALYFSTKGESFRPGPIDTLVTHDEEASSIRAQIRTGDMENAVKVVFQNHRKNIFLNEKRSSSLTLLQKYPVVLFSPESLQAIKQGPEVRRQLIDDFLVSFKLSNSKILADFKRTLRQKNQLLKDIRSGDIEAKTGRDILESLNISFLKLSAELSRARIEALQGLLPFMDQALNEIMNLRDVEISVDYLISSINALDFDRNELYSAMHNRLKELSQREIEVGTSLVGPHKHDIRFLFAKKDARYYCSQGQQRALILSFKMAQIMYHYRAYQIHPVLLLDDVLSELDLDKRGNLVRFLTEVNSQIFITTTELAFPYDFGNREISLFQIRGGHVERKGNIVDPT